MHAGIDLKLYIMTLKSKKDAAGSPNRVTNGLEKNSNIFFSLPLFSAERISMLIEALAAIP